MTCREFIEFLMQYLLGEVDREKFDAHLAVCSSCVNYLKTYQQTVKVSKAALADLDESLPKPPEELIRAILASRMKPR
ncbi:MAG: zf-HC2 domain-containing protein [Acidobacteria bacterium]|nr:zf-HC2 domain-containing protein [Acidobacteriota bacterium]MCI0568034.1 zf-HC2 domain-containing protein [Acidobacteriota bacterium]MCI0659115.1 zf-HC2 domain-containing protein [Acidobacteriota bacterium]